MPEPQPTQPSRRATIPWTAHLASVGLAAAAVAVVYGLIGVSGGPFTILALFVGAKYVGYTLAYGVVSTIPVLFMRKAWQPVAMHLAVLMVLWLQPGYTVSKRRENERARSESILPQVRRCFHLVRWSVKTTPFHVHVHVEGTTELDGAISLSVVGNGDGRGGNLRFDPAAVMATPGEVVLDTDASLDVREPNPSPVRELQIDCQQGHHSYSADAKDGFEMLEFGTVSIEHLLPAPEAP